MKAALGILAVVLIGFLAWTAWSSRADAQKVRAEVDRLEAVRDSAQAAADAYQARADSLGQKADSLTTALTAARVRADRNIREIETAADSLGEALKNALDSLGAPDTLKAIVNDLVGQTSRMRAEYAALLTLTDSTMATLRLQVTAGEQSNEGLRRALAAKDQQTAILEAALERALNPGWFTIFTRDVKTKAAVSVVAFVAGYQVSR